MNSQRNFENSPGSVTQARRFVAEVLADAPKDLTDVVAILVSELATNCIRHAGTPFSVSIECTDDLVRVEVTDTGAGAPTIRGPEPTDTTGRGLRIVDRLADDWGVTPLDHAPGKQVWFAIRLSAPADGRFSPIAR